MKIFKYHNHKILVGTEVKKIVLFLIMLTVSLRGMLEHRNALATAGIASSIASYYCLAKAIDPNSHFLYLNNEQKAKLICTAAVLKTSSLTLLTPKLAKSSHWDLRLCLEECGSFCIGLGIYNLETARAKYKNQPREYIPFLESNAGTDFAMGLLLMLLGTTMWPAVFINEDDCLQ